jgi:DNA-binding response OmpR family regulator
VLLVALGEAHEQLAGFLRQKGYDVATADTVEQALSYSRSIIPAALVLDLPALGTEGWRILQEFRSSDETAQVPVLALTAAQDQNTAASLGANAALMKPIDPASLLSTLEYQILRSPGVPSRVLVVDDDPEARELLEETLRSAGLLPVLASTGKQALEALARSPVSAIVVDLMMPEMSGFELILRIRQNPSFAVLPVIVLTAKEIDQEDAQVLSRQANAVFLKASPWREGFLAKVHQLLEDVIKNRAKDSVPK